MVITGITRYSRDYRIFPQGHQQQPNRETQREIFQRTSQSKLAVGIYDIYAMTCPCKGHNIDISMFRDTWIYYWNMCMTYIYIGPTTEL